MENVVHKQI